jgi:hypothetical protein
VSKMLKYLPPYERESKVFQEIMKAEEIELEKIHTEIKDLERQFFIDTATWGLAIYEKELKLPIRPNKSLEERRSIIKAKMRGMGKVDAEMIKAIVEAFTKSSVEVTFDGRINIIFNNEKVIQLNISDMFNAIDEVKPAHLDYDFTSKYSKELKLQAKYKEYRVPYLMCGTFLCGTKPYVQNEGVSFNTKLNVNTNKTNTSQRYLMTGTFKSGEAKL